MSTPSPAPSQSGSASGAASEPILTLTAASAALAGPDRDSLVQGIDPPDNLVKGMEQVLAQFVNLSDQERGTAYRGVAYGLVHGLLRATPGRSRLSTDR